MVILWLVLCNGLRGPIFYKTRLGLTLVSIVSIYIYIYKRFVVNVATSHFINFVFSSLNTERASFVDICYQAKPRNHSVIFYFVSTVPHLNINFLCSFLISTKVLRKFSGAVY